MIAVNMLKYLINPLVTWSLTHGQHEIFTPEIVSLLVGDVFEYLTKAADAGSPNEYLQVEVIQLCSTIVQFSHQAVLDDKKELISFLWWVLKTQDSLAKAYAFLCVSYFFRAFPSVGETVVMKAFVNMVRLQTYDAASRDAIRQAVDVIIPTLASIADKYALGVPGGEADATSAGSMETLGSMELSPMPANASSGRKYPSYALRLRQVIQEDGHSSGVLVHILQMIVRNRELFYTSRELFVPNMINSLSRLGLPSQSALENRILSVDLAATLLWWDGKAAEEQRLRKQEQAPMDTDKPTTDKEDSGAISQQPSVDTASDRENAASLEVTRLTQSMDDMVVNFLLRMAFVRCVEYILTIYMYDGLNPLR